jgi:hypothetical protein
MKAIIIFVIFLFMTSCLYGNPIPSKWRMQIDIGKEKFSYNDDFQYQATKNTNYEEESIYTRVTTSYFLLPPYFYLEAYGAFTPSTLSSTNETISVNKYEVNLRAGLTFSWDFLWLKLISENYFLTMTVSDNSFGYKNVENWVAYPVLGINTDGMDMGIHISIYYKIPIFKSYEQINESLIGVEIRVPLSTSGKLKYPLYAYQSSLIFTLEYKEYSFKYQFLNRKLEMESSSLIYMMGYNF